jgi:hypothetical protein
MDEPYRRPGAKIIRRNPRRGLYMAVAAALLAILAFAVFKRESSKQHPLRDTERTELCSLLPPPPAALAVLRQAPQPDAAHAATCEYFGADDKVALRVTLGSTKQLGDDGGLGLEPEFKRRLQKARAQYGNGGELPGDWDRGGNWHVGTRQSLLYLDQGVLVQFESDRLDAQALAAWAATVAKQLREVPASAR